jgi:hypothetical protein
LLRKCSIYLDDVNVATPVASPRCFPSAQRTLEGDESAAQAAEHQLSSTGLFQTFSLNGILKARTSITDSPPQLSSSYTMPAHNYTPVRFSLSQNRSLSIFPIITPPNRTPDLIRRRHFSRSYNTGIPKHRTTVLPNCLPLLLKFHPPTSQ